MSLNKGSGRQKPLGLQHQLPSTLELDVTNVLSTGAPMAMDGIHPQSPWKEMLMPGAAGILTC